MRSTQFGWVFLSLIVVLLVPGPTAAQNTNFGSAQNLMAGQQVEVTFDAVRTARYYTFRAVAGRSYCVETAPGLTETTIIVDSQLVVHRANLVTVLATNNDALQEPITGMNSSGGLSRACWIQPAAGPEPFNGEAAFIYVNQYPWAVATYRVRVVETTLFSNWFFLGGDYGSFTLLRNTTNTPLNYTIRWRDTSGNELGTFSGSLPGNGSTYKDGGDSSAVREAVLGTVEISHDGSPDAVVASTTVLSATTGLSFDAPFMRRTPW